MTWERKWFCLAFFIFLSLSLCYDKIYNCNLYSKMFSLRITTPWEGPSKIHYLNQTIALHLTPQLSFCWKKYKNSRAVIFLLALSHQDTWAFLSWDQSAWTELLRAEKSSQSLWTHAGFLRKENRFPSLSSSRVHVIMNSIISPPWSHPQKMIETMAWSPEYCILARISFSSYYAAQEHWRDFRWAKTTVEV